MKFAIEDKHSIKVASEWKNMAAICHKSPFFAVGIMPGLLLLIMPAGKLKIIGL